MSKSATAQGGGSLIWLQGLACGAMVALVPATALLLAVLLAPGLAALLLDRQPGRAVARSVLLFGAAACVGPVGQLWGNGQTVETSVMMLGDLGNIGTAWSAAAGGWLLAELLPVIVRVALEAASLARATRLRAARARLAEDWDAD
jgi:hypothetical protein